MESFNKFALPRFSPFSGENPFLNIDDRIVIFFDLETTGLSPFDNQITEIGIIVCNGKSLDVLETFNVKCELLPETKDRLDVVDGKMTIRDILNMNKYFEGSSLTSHESIAIKDAIMFISRYAKNGVIISHNASFDMKFINIRASKYKIKPLPTMRVYDTLKMSREFLIPALHQLEHDGDEQSAKTLDLLTSKFTKTGKRLKISSTLKSISSALSKGSGQYHTAIDDAKTLLTVFKSLVSFFEAHYKTIVDDDIFKSKFMDNKNRMDSYQKK